MSVTGVDFKDVSGTIVNSAQVQDYNGFEDPEKIGIKEFKAIKNKKGNLEIEIPAHSVVMLEWK